jgi:hypothetical protein
MGVIFTHCAGLDVHLDVSKKNATTCRTTPNANDQQANGHKEF